MSPAALPTISPGAAALVIFGCIAAFIALRGAARMLVASLILVASTWFAFRLWAIAPELSQSWLGKSNIWFEIGLPAAGFVVAFLLLGFLTRFLVKPFEASGSGGRFSHSIGVLLSTVLVLFVAVGVIHHVGAIENLKNPSKPGILGMMAGKIETIVPPKLMAWLDPTTSAERLHVASQFSIGAEPPRASVIDPATGLPIPRAIVIEEPELQQLADEGKFSKLLRHPLLTKFLDESYIKPFVKQTPAP